MAEIHHDFLVFPKSRDLVVEFNGGLLRIWNPQMETTRLFALDIMYLHKKATYDMYKGRCDLLCNKWLFKFINSRIRLPRSEHSFLNFQLERKAY